MISVLVKIGPKTFARLLDQELLTSWLCPTSKE